MSFLYYLLYIALIVLFFLNIRSTADLLCRTVGGFIFLYIYNACAAALSLPLLGVNLVSSFICGAFSLPGWLFLFLSAVFL